MGYYRTHEGTKSYSRKICPFYFTNRQFSLERKGNIQKISGAGSASEEGYFGT